MVSVNENGVCAPCQTRTYELGVFIGRFQPFHNGHLNIVREALNECDKLVVLVGSADQPRDYFNPFSYEERSAMILTSLPPEMKSRVICRPLLDYTYNDAKWVLQVQEQVAKAREEYNLLPMAKIALVGHQKDGTSFYLKMFPQWASIGMPGFFANGRELSSTHIRETFFTKTALFEEIQQLLPTIPEQVGAFMAKFSRTDAYYKMIDEYEFVEAYKRPYANLPYPPIFQTVDACVIQSGHILLVKRKGKPGRGLWALPGGFLNASERIEDAVYRELREETKIKVPEPVLRGSTVTQRTFDQVYRSARGRTITTAFLIHLKGDTDLPKVKGADDAEKARWVPIADLKRSELFEDHHAIIMNLIGLL